MASTRLPSLLCTAWRYGEVCSPVVRSARAAQRIRAYHPAHQLRQERIQQRYGTANEPPPHLEGSQTPGEAAKQQQSQETKALPKIGEKLQQDGSKAVKTEEKPDADAEKKEAATVDGRAAATTPPITDPILSSHDTLTTPMDEKRALDTILQSVPDPAPQRAEESAQEELHAEDHHDKSFDEHSPPVKAPHIERPRYIHHFDTYGLVRRLKEGGWDEAQAVTAMKAMRVILADKTDLAKEALVSKSNLENEQYLFKAACAELKTEVTARRKTEQEKMRTERTQLQHGVDIISQRISQEGSALKDELKGMFDDRKMAVRNEQREMESKIQRANYRITVELQADAKSEVEELRWIMTRRVIITLGLVVFMIVGGLKLAANAMEGATKSKPKAENVVVVDESGKTTGGRVGELVGREGDAGYVSLG